MRLDRRSISQGMPVKVYAFPAKALGLSQPLISVEVMFKVLDSKACENFARSAREETNPPALITVSTRRAAFT